MNSVKTVLCVGSAYYFTLLMLDDFSKEASQGQTLKILYNDLDSSLFNAMGIVAKENSLSMSINTDSKPNYITFTKI
ncbi:hypothetical protein IG206_00880 [Candidatus Parvarchaeota archaeon]|nr:hypothetical protein [Candidatus Acidifodinimicrobium mancum]